MFLSVLASTFFLSVDGTIFNATRVGRSPAFDAKGTEINSAAILLRTNAAKVLNVCCGAIKSGVQVNEGSGRKEDCWTCSHSPELHFQQLCVLP